MSRIGNRIITVPTGVTVEETNGVVTVKGPKGSLSQPMLKDISMKIEENKVVVERKNEAAKALHGTMNALIQNMITGVTEGYTKYLILNGVGYKAALKGEDLVLNLGFSHPIEVKCESGIKFKVLTPAEVNELNLGKEGVGTVVAVSGIDNEKVGLIAGKIRDLRPVEPYHMYGVRYRGERVRRKESKAGAKGSK